MWFSKKKKSKNEEIISLIDELELRNNLVPTNWNLNNFLCLPKRPVFCFVLTTTNLISEWNLVWKKKIKFDVLLERI